MNILFDIGHPAQVYNFKYIYQKLASDGHHLYVTAIDKDITIDLLDKFEIPYIKLKNTKKSLFLKLCWIIWANFKALKIQRKYKIDLVVSRMSLYHTIPAWLFRKKHIGLCDTESAMENKLISKFMTLVLSSDSFKKSFGGNHYKIKSNIELFYLHPNQFSLPQDARIELLGIEANTPYVIMRFVSWDAFHDKGLSGFTDNNKIIAAQLFSEKARVFISSEKALPVELQKYQIKIPPEKMHQILAHASLFFGESATMASESAVLGVPAIYLDKNGRGYIDEEAKFGLAFHYKNSIDEQEKAIDKGNEILGLTASGKSSFSKKHADFLSQKIDASSFLVWLIENMPESLKVIKSDLNIQDQFITTS